MSSGQEYYLQDGQERHERRHFSRLAASVDVNYSLLEKKQDKNIKAVSKNIAAGGICIIAYEQLKTGSVLELNINIAEINRTVKAKGKVIWNSEFTVGQDQPRYDVGVEFVEISDSDRQLISQYVFKLQ